MNTLFSDWKKRVWERCIDSYNSSTIQPFSMYLYLKSVIVDLICMFFSTVDRIEEERSKS